MCRLIKTSRSNLDNYNIFHVLHKQGGKKHKLQNEKKIKIHIKEKKKQQIMKKYNV